MNIKLETSLHNKYFVSSDWFSVSATIYLTCFRRQTCQVYYKWFDVDKYFILLDFYNLLNFWCFWFEPKFSSDQEAKC